MQKELELVTFLHISVVLSSTHVPLMETSIQGENQVLFLLVICIFVAVFFSFTRIFHLFKCNSSCHLPFAVDDCFFFYCSLQFCNRKVTSPCKLCSIFLSSLCEFTLHRNKFLYFIVISILFTGFVMFCGYCTC